MKKIILLFLLCTIPVFSQTDFVGKKEIYTNESGVLKRQTVLSPLPVNGAKTGNSIQNSFQPQSSFNNTAIKWSYTEPAAIGDFCEVSGNGKYNLVSWNLNNKRISLYNNSDANPLWEFATNPLGFYNYISISDTGGTIGTGAYQNIYLFNNTSNVPYFNFDLTRLADTGSAAPLDVSSDGHFVVSTVSRYDSSTVIAFSSSSSGPVWVKKIISSILNGSSIQGVKLSGNDSLVIVNTYYDFYVFKTFTGELVYQASIGGTQAVQGISGDGSIIATINYNGLLRVYKWNGTTYNLLFQNQEPSGMFYNWYTAVDVSYDGDYIAAGTLNFLTTSTYDGKIKVFKQTSGGTPDWTFTGCGDEVTKVSFSKSSNILSASSFGEFNNTTEDLYIFKTHKGNVPIFKLNTPGSFFWCSTSNDGRTVLASGKAVHARSFGSGGILYNIDVDTSDAPSAININSNLINDYELYQNYPNPFNPTTKISYQLRDANFVSLKIFDMLGNEVATLINGRQDAGSHEITFDGSGLSSGIYFYKLGVKSDISFSASDYTKTMKMILLK